MTCVLHLASTVQVRITAAGPCGAAHSWLDFNMTINLISVSLACVFCQARDTPENFMELSSIIGVVKTKLL